MDERKQENVGFMTTQTPIIKQAVMYQLDHGFTDKQEIINIVTQELGVPRPTVRRVVRELAIELRDKAKILEGGV